jgi:hypothetical protein
MEQNSALRILENVLSTACETEANNNFGSIVLLAMQLEDQPGNIIAFYGLLSRAREEATSLKKEKIERYVKTLDDLYRFFVENNLWGGQKATFYNYIQQRGILNTLDSLADFFGIQSPRMLLNDDFLQSLKLEIDSILENVINSDLSKDIKDFLIKAIEGVLGAIRKYKIDGGEGLEQAIKILVSELVICDHTIKDEDKKEPSYFQTASFFMSFLFWIVPNPYTLYKDSSTVNNLTNLQFTQVIDRQKKIENILNNCSSMKECIEQLSSHPQKAIAGKKQPVLPAAK